MHDVKGRWASDNMSLYMQTTVPVHANYCPCTCKCRLLSLNMQAACGFLILCILGDRGPHHVSFLIPILFQRRPPSEPGAHQNQLNWLASKNTNSILLFLPPQCQDYRYVLLQQAFLCECLGKKAGPQDCTASELSLSLSVFLKKTFIFLSLLGLPDQKCPPPKLNSG